uniref:G_PROTEIN_RECEP_F1_2 domain-containing protein n=1 Tax=Caenorhabditis tropicalis TaxID=1561998 RepID=A0A1I7TTV2_9PELO
MECLLLCFERKHQSIARISKTHVLPKFFRILVYFAWIVSPFNVYTWFSTLSLPEDEKFDYIMENAPELLQDFIALPNFDIYRKTTSFTLFFTVIILIGILLNVLFVLCSYDIFQLMAGIKLQISPKRYQKHQEAVISIMVQFGTSIICFVPPFFLAIIIIAHIGEAQSK